MDEKPRQEGRQDDAKRGKHEAGAENWADVGNLGVEPAGEEDYAQGHGADALRQWQAFEVDAKPVAPAQHANAQEEQQQWDSKLVSRLASEDTEKKQKRYTKQYSLDSHDYLY